MIKTSTRLQYVLGYLKLNLLSEALRELRAIGPADRKSAPVLQLETEIAFSQQAWPLILRVAPRAVAADPTVERPWIAWSYALRELQRTAEARDVLLRGEAAIADATVLVDYNLACYFCLLGDLAEARRRLERVYARDPEWRAIARDDSDLALMHVE